MKIDVPFIYNIDKEGEGFINLKITPLYRNIYFLILRLDPLIFFAVFLYFSEGVKETLSTEIYWFILFIMLIISLFVLRIKIPKEIHLRNHNIIKKSYKFFRIEEENFQISDFHEIRMTTNNTPSAKTQVFNLIADGKKEKILTVSYNYFLNKKHEEESELPVLIEKYCKIKVIEE